LFGIVGVLLLLISMLSSCSLQKYIPAQSLIVKKTVLQISSNKYPQLVASEINPYIQPKTKKKLFFTRLRLWLYYRHQEHPGGILIKFLNKNLGEEPIYFYSGDADRNVRKVKKYMNDLGFFHSKASFDVIRNGKFVDLVYHISPSEPYRYDSIQYRYPDSTLRYYISRNLSTSLIKRGDIYNAYTLDKERDRITNNLRSKGYYDFNRNYIQFELDTNLNKKQMKVLVDIREREVPDENKPNQMITKPHLRYFVRNVFVIPDYNPLKQQVFDTIEHLIYFKGDTTAYHYSFLCLPKKRFSLFTFNNAILIKPKLPFSADDVQKTYQKLFHYPILKVVNITFDTVSEGMKNEQSTPFLNANIQLQTGKLNTLSLETMGTNSNGDLGINGVLSFVNRNVFKRAEVLRLRLMGGFEAQNIGFLSPDSSIVAPVNALGIFNTFEAGVDATVFFPMTLFPFRHIRIPGNPQTNIGMGFNFQRRPYYSRKITNMDIGYSWNQSPKIKHVIVPLNINFVSVSPSLEFQHILNNETNQRLKEQYSDHMIVGIKYSVIYNNQKPHHIGNFNYLRLNFESSGNLLNGINKIIGSQRTLGGYYNILGIRYSQYVRISSDYRHYIHFDQDGTALVLRSLLGLAIPYGNSNDIPYEKGFYAGGANGMRGWRFRTLGPGSFQTQDAFERIGDIQLEGNMEFRFPVYQFIKSALFIDAGNIWNYHQTDTYPGGHFQWNSFASEIAIDAGMGIRLDFSYFIFRLDAAVPLRNPAYPMTERWRFQHLSWRDVVGNFGIGYPF